MKNLVSIPRAIGNTFAQWSTVFYLQYLATAKAFANDSFGGPIPTISGTPEGGLDETRQSVPVRIRAQSANG